MAAPQLSIRSARARDLAHELARIERRPVNAIVEDALTSYAASKGQVSFKEFLAKIQAHSWPVEDGEVSLDEFMAELDAPYEGPRL
jgi:hypothetical protein